MKTRKILGMALVATAMLFNACGDDSSSASAIENVESSSSEEVVSSSSLSSSSGDKKTESSSSVLVEADVCADSLDGASYKADGIKFVCGEGKSLREFATFDSLAACDSLTYGDIVYIADEADAYTCDTDGRWRRGILEVDLHPVVAEPGKACADSLDGFEAFVESENAMYACKEGKWVMAKSFAKSSSSVAVHEPVPVDYSKGRAMNKRLGKGINLGNAWDSQGNRLDCSWNNCIDSSYFRIIKEAGFNSVRIPVRWHYDSDYGNHTVNPNRLKGVKEHIQMALDQGLAVIVNFHHYTDLNDAGNNYKADSVMFLQEKEHFLALWKQVAREMDEYPDSLLVLELLNEPIIASAELVDGIMNDAYKVVRENAPGKTIMFEAYHAAKFYDINRLNMPVDGNIIYSGHYYEPYSYTHQGNGYDCKGDATLKLTAAADFKKYVDLAESLYPDINGGHIPMNMGEFGVSGQPNYSCKTKAPSDSSRALWTKEAIKAAESYDMSWQYWGFVGVGGFEAYNKGKGEWYEGFLDAFFGE